MRTLPAGLAAHLASGATTLCRCWRITRRDGEIQGFTDHDEPLVFDGTTFAAGTGFEGTEIEARLGLAVGGHEIHGALAADSIAEADLAAGRYDDAKVELFLVDWSETENRLLLRAGNLGEVRREGAAFAAEVRGLAHRLNEEKGRLYSPTCDADLGDARCGVDLENPAYRGEGTVAAVEGAESHPRFRTRWLRRRMVRARPAAMDRRRQRGPRSRSERASRRGGRSADFAVAIDA